MDAPNYFKIAAGLFVLLNPFVLIPVFLGLTEEMSDAERTRTANVTALAVFTIVGIAVFAGKYALAAFGITVDDFRVAGGLLILLMALSMARAHEREMRYTDTEHAEALQKDTNIAVVPLAIPLMAGPATISGAIIDAQVCHTLSSRLILMGIVAGCSGVLWLAMLLAEQIGRFLGHTGQQVLTRIMGLVLLAVAVDFLAEGLRNLFLLHP